MNSTVTSYSNIKNSMNPRQHFLSSRCHINFRSKGTLRETKVSVLRWADEVNTEDKAIAILDLAENLAVEVSH